MGKGAKQLLTAALSVGIMAAMPAFAQEAVEATAAAAEVVAPNSGDTAWMLTSSLLVLMMTVPGLALFYGGLVARNNVLATLMQSVAICCIVSILWPVIGYTLAFTDGTGWAGGMSKAMLAGITPSTLSGTIPETVFIMFQGTFAIITCALLVGSVANRIKFSAICIMAPLWLLLVYAPICHWVWGPGGFIGGIGRTDPGLFGFGYALDFAGGSVVHINSGIAGLVAALVLGKGLHYESQQSTPTNLIQSVLGTGLLWVGWFGFNAGSALTAGTGAGMAMLVTNSAAAAAGIAWMVAEWMAHGKPSVTGTLSGVVAGLVAITPASGFVGFSGSLIIGFSAGIICFLACAKLKKVLRYDDSLDVFGIHGVGGIVGCILTGIFATNTVNPLGSGYVDGNSKQVIAQLISAGIVAVYSGVMTYVILKVVGLVVGLRVSEEVEENGLDMALHGEAVHR